MNDEITRLEKEVEEAQKRLTEARRRRGPEPVKDYTLKRPDGSAVKLSELFGGREDLLVIHNMGKKCVYCTLWADGLKGFTPHIESRTAFALVSPDEPAVMKEFASGRGWNFACVSTHGSPFARDLGYEKEPGQFQPGASAFRRGKDGSIERVGKASFGPGDVYCAIWHLFDLLEGGPKGWGPKYEYAKKA